ncbi:carboxylate/amino acid/amine transporter [Utexia brackfieldae]|uniref:carboxylate/amino acid/amine transporter n=1 Tax=Utexia brackfieldae TaxID=3074108 RepID=UPI00370D5864
MFYLIIVTLIWSFSFSFIAIYLSNQIDIWFAVFIRILLACILFLPFLRLNQIKLRIIILLMSVGAFQLGFMYIFYYQSFLYITVPEILLFTIMTPIYITLIYDILRKQRFRLTYLLTAIIAVFGALIIRYNNLNTHFMIGFLLIQGANLCFALGQVGYKRVIELHPMPQHQAFSWVYIGAVIVAIFCWVLFGQHSEMIISPIQWGILFWLGLVASGLCYFLWNYGATKVDAGTLAIMNNLVIPCGIIVNVLVWHQSIDWIRFIAGSITILIALYIHQRWIVSQ